MSLRAREAIMQAMSACAPAHATSGGELGTHAGGMLERGAQGNGVPDRP